MAKMGRPTKYREDYCDQLIDHMDQGYSFESFAGFLRVNLDTLYEWCKIYPDFSEAKEIGRLSGLFHDEKIFKAIMVGKIKAPPGPIIYKFKCRYHKYGWREEDGMASGSDKIEVFVRRSKDED